MKQICSVGDTEQNARRMLVTLSILFMLPLNSSLLVYSSIYMYMTVY